MNFIVDIERQIKRILVKFKEKDFQFNFNKNSLNDFKDANIYQQFHLKNPQNCFTFTLNTDGISLCKKSKLSIWPIILVINELPLSVRYCIENTIITGQFNY